MSGNSAFELVTERGWRSGLGNMLRAEFQSWWKTRTWFIQAIIWIGVVDAILAMVLFSTGAADQVGMPLSELVMLYSIFGGMFTTVGVVIVMQDAVVGEKVTGTAAWVLSKPISRSSFILAKLVSNAVGFAVTATLVPGIVAYLIITLGTGESLSIPRFLGGMGVLFLFELFWLVFTLMLGTFFQSRGPVIGLPLALILGQQFILGLLMSFSPGLVNFLPYALIMMPDVATEPSITVSVILGIQPETWLPLIASIFLTILFLLVGIWRFSREEF